MLSKELETTLNQAFKSAREQRHEFMTVEHLLLALIDNPTAAKVLRACGADLNQLRRQLTEFILPVELHRLVKLATRQPGRASLQLLKRSYQAPVKQ
jgi:ATP-dependent Clp protease ATP-binding subunit ClpA